MYAPAATLQTRPCNPQLSHATGQPSVYDVLPPALGQETRIFNFFPDTQSSITSTFSTQVRHCRKFCCPFPTPHTCPSSPHQRSWTTPPAPVSSQARNPKTDPRRVRPSSIWQFRDSRNAIALTVHLERLGSRSKFVLPPGFGLGKLAPYVGCTPMSARFAHERRTPASPLDQASIPEAAQPGGSAQASRRKPGDQTCSPLPATRSSLAGSSLVF